MTSRRLALDAFLPYRLSIASNAVSKVIASAYADAFDLAIPEWRLIAVLHDHGGASQQELVRRTLMDKVAVSRAAQTLESRGLVQREEDAQDARVRRLRLTDAGVALFDQIAPLALSYERRLLADFSETEIKTLMRLLERLERAAAALSEET
jgi:DNA-binding MarR family transcriptional regulator